MTACLAEVNLHSVLCVCCFPDTYTLFTFYPAVRNVYPAAEVHDTFSTYIIGLLAYLVDSSVCVLHVSSTVRAHKHGWVFLANFSFIGKIYQ